MVGLPKRPEVEKDQPYIDDDGAGPEAATQQRAGGDERRSQRSGQQRAGKRDPLGDVDPTESSREERANRQRRRSEPSANMRRDVAYTACTFARGAGCAAFTGVNQSIYLGLRPLTTSK